MAQLTLQQAFDLAFQHYAAGRFQEAEPLYRQIVTLQPENADAHFFLGAMAHTTGQFDSAVDWMRRALAVRPAFPAAQYNLGVSLQAAGRLDEAIAAYRATLVLDPHLHVARDNLGSQLVNTGRIAEGIATFREALALNPNQPGIHSNLVYALHFDPVAGSAAIAEEARRWDAQHGAPLRGEIRPWPNDRDPARRLRIGYVSPNFRDHAEGFFTAPLLAAHDHAQFEIHCYASVARPDALTARLRSCADVWRDVLGETDAELAARIRADGIDILVDLTMHMGFNRMPLFARKPAPVQVAWLAYPGSTGLAAMDYRLSDPWLDPPGMDESIYSERTIRLPDSFWCYEPTGDRDLTVNPLPAGESGPITFGCLNNFCKVNAGVLDLWAQVLRAVPGSRLLLLAPPGSHRERVLERLGDGGVELGRVEFVPVQSRRSYLETYHRIDLALDTFPYNGHTTSLDSFWMGVPVVTLFGQTAVGRGGWSLLSNLGLPELAARTPEDFVEIAVALARDVPRLATLRAGLREKMQASPLMDAPRFARGIEAAYRGMWRAWCAGR
jgi:predicted O-linked N-acetylglucosamine transferase (SPINDLY family)